MFFYGQVAQLEHSTFNIESTGLVKVTMHIYCTGQLMGMPVNGLNRSFQQHANYVNCYVNANFNTDGR
jgi:hypothetical protein